MAQKPENQKQKLLEVSMLLALVIAASFALSACTSNAAQQASLPPPLVEVVTLSPANADIQAEFPAQTFARDMVEVRGRVDGYLEKWLFRPGQQVKQGQPLYVLDRRPYRAQVEQAQGNVQQTDAELTFARKQVSLLQAEANLASAEANLVKARQDYERLKPLVEQDAAAKQDLDAAVAALRAAEASVRANKANVEQTRLTTETQIDGTQGKLQAQRAALENAQLNIQYGTIRAPISGLIGDSLVPVGGLVTANSAQPLTTIVPLDQIWVRFKVSEAQHLAFLKSNNGMNKEGPQLELFLADNTRFPSTGRITNSLNQVDARTGTLEMQAQFPNPEHKLLPGQFVRVRFVVDRREGAILVPQRAVQQNQNLQVVYTVGADNKVQSHVIKTGARVGESLIVEEGLQPGERVVVEGLLSVRPGMPVRPTPYKEKPAVETRKAD